MSENFSRNLRSLCAECGSIAQVCREIGLNRQQFNRYLNGCGMPSAYNLRRIALHFNVSEEDLEADQAAFTAKRARVQNPISKGPAQLLSSILKANPDLYGEIWGSIMGILLHRLGNAAQSTKVRFDGLRRSAAARG